MNEDYSDEDYDAAVASSLQPNLSIGARLGVMSAADTNPDSYTLRPSA